MKRYNHTNFVRTKKGDDDMVEYRQRSFYEITIKRGLDWIFSTLLIIILSPLLGGIAVWIKLDDPDGKILFRQTRVGQNGSLFTIYKFRSMKTGTPNIPTAEFVNPESFITRSGRFLRKSSLDELPQLFNVWKGEMSFVGPRPLIPDDKYVLQLRHQSGVESVLPGITGLAQVNGRDEISNDAKAYFDAKYVQNLNLKFDTKIILKTVVNVIRSKGVHEGKKQNKYF